MNAIIKLAAKKSQDQENNLEQKTRRVLKTVGDVLTAKTGPAATARKGIRASIKTIQLNRPKKLLGS